ncbi:hypothetical protein GIB67_009316 [Kingdonia uniflora]|uniref:Uncharacterized protein n=1 Tax=Kingdonia uniflora TaxID=39325 RepID=A0A7J7N2U4_9MAGN|nr:hypothetical protein GIB67_009316 [Kingdonia uniflora]
MGSCLSVSKTPDSAMKADTKLFISSPIKEKEPMIVDYGFKSRHFGSKEETFFDSQAWLDSDCEDDFLSVNGDFTPSCGNTPNRLSNFAGTPLFTKPFTERAPNLNQDPTPVNERTEPSHSTDGTPKSQSESPTDKKKKLFQLFEDNVGGEEDFKDLQTKASTVHNLPPKSANGSPYLSGANSIGSSERTPNKGTKPDKQRLSRSVQCCLPSLIPSRNSTERKNKRSPANNGGG